MFAGFNRRLTSLCEAVAGAGVLVLAALISATVFLRFVLGAPAHWAEELPRLVLVWSALVGAVVCSQRGSHLTAGIGPLLFRSPRLRARIDRFCNLLLVALFCIFAKAGWDLAMLTMGQTTAALQLPAGILYLAVPVACGALALVHLGRLLAPAEAA